jgi:1-phosphatidylinositol-4-phosphate 5-kinase
MRKNATLKDLDWIDAGKELQLGPQLRKPFLKQLGRDAEFLNKLGVMDYSLLIGIHHEDRPDEPRKDSTSPNVPSPKLTLPKQANSTKSMKIDKRKTIEERSTRKSKKPSKHDSDKPSKHDSDKPSKHENENARPNRQRTVKSKAHKRSLSDWTDAGEHVGVTRWEQEEGGMRGTNEDGNHTGEIYFIAIIDILMLYTIRKRVEHNYKSLRFDGEVSSVNPTAYSQRFVAFVESIVK